MTTIVHVITGLQIGGAETMLCKLIEGSTPEHFRHVVISLMEPGPIGRDISAYGIPVESLSMRAGVPDPRAIVRLRRLLRRHEPDIIQTWLYHANLMGLLGSLPSRTPVIWNLRNSFHRKLGLEVVAIARSCALLSWVPMAIVTNSEVAKRRHMAIGYRPREWLVIPNGFDTARFAPSDESRRSVRQELGLSDDALLIGLVGRFHSMKGHRLFLQAAGTIARARPDIGFLLIGRDVTAENQALREIIERERLSNQAYLLGERQDIPRLTAAMDVATNASTYGESFSNAIGEAMSSGVPCVVTDVGDMAQVVADTGRILTPGDALALAQGWSELIGLGFEGRAELGLRARARIEARYSLESVVRQYEALYARLAGTQ